MKFYNYIKETSERSAKKNWVQEYLIDNSEFVLESIEGCNQNNQNLVTHWSCITFG